MIRILAKNQPKIHCQHFPGCSPTKQQELFFLLQGALTYPQNWKRVAFVSIGGDIKPLVTWERNKNTQHFLKMDCNRRDDANSARVYRVCETQTVDSDYNLKHNIIEMLAHSNQNHHQHSQNTTISCSALNQHISSTSLAQWVPVNACLIDWPAGLKIALRFPRLSVGLFVCASPLIMCTTITPRTLLSCKYTVDFSSCLV